MGADSGTFSTPKIIENRMISIVFLRKWEVMGAPARPPRIIENVMISIVFGGKWGVMGAPGPPLKSLKPL